MLQQLVSPVLRKRYGESEARAMVRLLLEDAFNLTLTDICSGAIERLPKEDKARLTEMIQRLEEGEPTQYVTGKAAFYGRYFLVTPSVLIPRPETEELCHWIIEDYKGLSTNILDIGTGSGCIAVTLAKELVDASVTALDISTEALLIAKENATRLKAKVHFQQQDALHLPTEAERAINVIVSNPPYIPESEEVADIVRGNEPRCALFVPDSDPLIFYRAIAEYGRKSLEKGGSVYFEINPRYASELVKLLNTLGYKDPLIRRDLNGKERMIKATYCKDKT